MCDEDPLWNPPKFVMFPQDDHYNSLFEAFVSMCNKDLGPIDPDWYTRGTALQISQSSRTRRSLSHSASWSPFQQTSSQSPNQSTPRHLSNEEARVTDPLCQSALWTPLSCTDKRNECEHDVFKTPGLPEKELRQSLGAEESGLSVTWSPSFETPPHVPFGAKAGRRQMTPKTLFQDTEKKSPTSNLCNSALENDFEECSSGSGTENEAFSFRNKTEASVLGCEVAFEVDGKETGLGEVFPADASCVEAQPKDVNESPSSKSNKRSCKVVVSSVDQVENSRGKDGVTEVRITERRETQVHLLSTNQDKLSHNTIVTHEPGEGNANTPSSKLCSNMRRTNLQSRFKERFPQQDVDVETDDLLGDTQLDGCVTTGCERGEEKMDVSFAKSQNDFLKGGYSLTQILEAAESTAACIDAPDFVFTQTESSENASSVDLLADVDWEERPEPARAPTDKGDRIGRFAASSPMTSAPSFATPCNVSRKSKRKAAGVAPCAGEFGVVSPINGVLHKERPQVPSLAESNKALMTGKVFTGFTTGTGNLVSVSAKALKAAQRLLCSVKMDAAEGLGMKDNCLQDISKVTNCTDRKAYEDAAANRSNGSTPAVQCGNFVPTGFSTAGGKSIKVSATALNSAKELLSKDVQSAAKSCQQDEAKRAKRCGENATSGTCSELDASGEKLKTAFTTGSGKAVLVSKASLSSAHEILSEDKMMSSHVQLLAPGNANVPIEVKARNSAQISVKGSFLSSASDLPADRANYEATAHEQHRTYGEGNRDVHKHDENNIKAEFVMGHGKSVTVGESSVKAAEGLVVDAEESASDGEKFRNVRTFFTTGSGRAAFVSADSLKNAELLFRDEAKDTVTSHKVVTGFTTGGGKQVHVTKESLKAAKTLLSESKHSLSPDENCNALQTLPGGKRGLNNEKVMTGFSTGSGKAVTVSKNALASAQSHLNSMTDVSDSKNICHFGNVQKRQEENSIKQDGNKQQDLNMTNKTGTCTEKKADRSTALEERIRGDSALGSSRQAAAEEQPQHSTSFTTEQKRTPQIQRMFTSKMRTPVGVRSSVTPFKAVVRTSTPARGTLQRGVVSGTPLATVSCAKKNPVQPGKLWILRKLQKLPRISMRQACGNPCPQVYSLKELENFGVPQPTASITSKNAGDHQFGLPSSDELVILGDGIILSPHSELQFGKKELYDAFIKMPGVEPSLICEKWFANHYRWVVWKLAAMEQHFPQVFGGRALTPDQVMLQMKYRYDTEIDNSSRPALRKIVEQDDIPSKTMVLCVSSIKQENNAASLEVTDGWYSMRTELDEPLMKMVTNGRIFCGQKLITSCAELVGSVSACTPLEIPDDMALKINFNTTRRARWDARLGYFRSPQPFPVPLASLHPKGGPAGRVDCVVVRTYPLLYLEKLPNGTSVMRNERTEHLVAAEHERVRAEHVERLMAETFSQAEKADGESGTLQGVKSVRATYSVEQIRSLSSGKDIWKALQCCADSPEVESLLSEDQVRMLKEYQEQCYNQKQTAMEEKFQQVLQAAEDEGRCPRKRTVVPVLKVLLGGLHEKDLQKNVCCIASVWRPCPELQEMLTEGKAVSFYNVGVCPVRNVLPDVCNSAVELTTLKHTKYKTVDCPDHVRIYYERQVTSFPLLQSQQHGPQSRATDIVGVVFLIHRKEESDTVFLTDPWFNFVQVAVYGGCDAFTTEGKVSIRQVVTATDLVVKPKQQDYKNTVALATTELSEISPSPRRPHLRDAVAFLRERTPDVDLLASSALQKFSAAQRRQSAYPTPLPARRAGSTPISRVYATRNSASNTPAEAGNQAPTYLPNVASASFHGTNTSITGLASAVARPLQAPCSTPSSAGRLSPSYAAMCDGLILSNTSSVEPGSPAEALSKQIKARIALLQCYGALAPLPPLSVPESMSVKRSYRAPVRRRLTESPPMDLDDG